MWAFEVATHSQLHLMLLGLWSSVGSTTEEGRREGWKEGRKAVAGLLLVPVALGRLWMPVGGHACPGTHTNSSSHHQHKPAGRRTVQKKPIYPLCVCVCVCLLLLSLCVNVCRKVGGRGVWKKSLIILTEKERGMGTRPSCWSSSERKWGGSAVRETTFSSKCVTSRP